MASVSPRSEHGTPSDTEACVQLWLAALEARDGAPAVDGTAERCLSKFAVPRVSWRVSRDDDGSILGFGLLAQPGTGGSDGPADAAYLSLLAVDPDTQGRGLGAQLLADLVADARAAGYSSAVLHALVGMPATGLYVSRGWMPLGEPFDHPLNGRSTQTYVLDPLR